MANDIIRNITYSDVPQKKSYSIKNFFISNHEANIPDLSFESPFFFDGIMFCICLNGTGKVRINFKEYLLKKNDLITILPKQIIEKSFFSDDLVGEVLAFSPDFLTEMPIQRDYELPKKIALNPVLAITDRDMQNILRYYSFIIETFNNERRNPFFEQIIKGQLFSLIHEIISLYIEHKEQDKEKPSSRNEEIVERFLNLLKDNFKEGRSAAYYADKMFLTPKYLSGVIKKVTGRPINSWIEDIIIIGSKILLKSTNLTVLQISEELNFPNPSYFGRFFKKKTGMTPVDFRES